MRDYFKPIKRGRIGLGSVVRKTTSQQLIFRYLGDIPGLSALVGTCPVILSHNCGCGAFVASLFRVLDVRRSPFTNVEHPAPSSCCRIVIKLTLCLL